MQLATTHSLADLLRESLDEAEALSGSRIGFFHFVETDQVTLSLQAWSSNTIKNMCKALGAGFHYPVEQAGVWADCLRERKPIVHNNYASLSHRKGLPSGHAPVVRELVVPVIRNDLLVALLGVGNKPTDYDNSDVMALLSLADFAWDIADGRRHQDALQKGMDDLREAHEISRMCRWVLDLLTNRFKWMDLAFAMPEVDPASFASTYEAFLELVYPDDRSVFDQTYRESVNDRKPFEIEHRMVMPDGGIRWFNNIGRTEYDDTGLAIRSVGTLQDITERKMTQELLPVQAEILSLLNQSAPVAKIAADIVTALQRATSFCAVGLRLKEGDDFPFVASVGYSNEFLQKENVLTIRLPTGGLCRNQDGSVSLECTCGLLLESKRIDPSNPLFSPGGSAWTNDASLISDVPADQDPRLHPRNRCIHVGFMSLALIPIRSGGETFGLLHLADRTRGRFTPESIIFFEGVGASIGLALCRKAVELQNMLKTSAIEQISHVISHDLRSPLITIGTFLGHLEQDLGQVESTRVKEDLIFIDAAVDKMTRLLDGLQKAVRLGRIVGDPVKINVVVLVQRALGAIAGEILTRGVAINLHDLDITLYGDCVLLEEVWQNLIENSVKYMGDQPSPYVELGTRMQGSDIVFFVRDNGIGIEPRFHDKVFLMFAKQNAASAGIGMGLPLVKNVVELYEGRIWLESDGAGKGSTFYFTLPKAQEIRKARPALS
jgi:signal transduction histidine kinase/PAS domain-containing protein